MDWHFRYTGPGLPLLARIKVWFWLRRCERITKRAMENPSEFGLPEIYVVDPATGCREQK